MMATQLYLELLSVAAILLGVLLINNIFLYKQKISDRISIMLISGIVMCAFEIAWALIDGHPEFSVLAYIVVCGYSVAFIVFAAFLNLYLLDRLGVRPGKIALIIFYALPAAVTALLCAATPWTQLMFRVDESGVVKTMELFDTFFHSIVYLYIFSPLIVAVYFLTLGKKKRPDDCEIPVSMFVFGVMAPVLYWAQIMILGGGDEAFETTSLPVALALAYLVTNVSTHNALKARANLEAVETDLRIASKIQTDALPPVAPEFAEHLDLNLRGSMNTAKEVGGDFYDYFPIDDNRICFLIADVSGKGTPAALFMMTAKTMIKDYALTRESTSEIFTAVNARLCESNDEGMFATAWIGILDIRTMILQYTNAGHNYPMFQRKGQPCEMISKNHGLFLAGMDFTMYKHEEIQLEPGDRLLLYTDGVTEAHNVKSELYGEERLIKVMEDTRALPGEQVLECILDDVNRYAEGVPQFDDMTMVILTIKA